jgi:penicillin-insensitive murein endopeptidase
MVPLVNDIGKSVPMPTSVLNKWGYDLEIDSLGRLEELTIDAEAMAEHIYQLHLAAKKHGAGIWRVIFDPDLQPLLHSTARWEYLSDNVQFSEKRSWVRHDEHYHVDFEVSCEPAAWATTTTMARYPHSAEEVPDDLHIPKWSWHGLVCGGGTDDI